MRGSDAGLAEHTAHGAVMYAQLAGERAHRPALGVMQPQDLGLELQSDHGNSRPSDLSAPRPASKPRPRRQQRATEAATTL